MSLEEGSLDGIHVVLNDEKRVDEESESRVLGNNPFVKMHQGVIRK